MPQKSDSFKAEMFVFLPEMCTSHAQSKRRYLWEGLHARCQRRCVHSIANSHKNVGVRHIQADELCNARASEESSSACMHLHRHYPVNLPHPLQTLIVQMPGTSGHSQQHLDVGTGEMQAICSGFCVLW